MNSTSITQAPKDKKDRHAWRLEQQRLHDHHQKLSRNLMLVYNEMCVSKDGKPYPTYHISRNMRDHCELITL